MLYPAQIGYQGVKPPAEKLAATGVTSDTARKLRPMLVAQVYLWGVLAIFAFGPWPWPVQNPIQLYGFLTLAHIALFAGYWFRSRGPIPRPKAGPNADMVVLVSSIAVLIVYGGLIAVRQAKGFSLEDVIYDPGAAYNENNAMGLALERGSNVPVIGNMRTFLSPLLFFSFPIGALYWSELKWITRSVFLGGTLCYSFYWLFIGTNKGLADLVIQGAGVALIKYSLPSPQKRIFSRAATVLLVVAGLIGFLGFFTYNMISRKGSEAIRDYLPVPGIELDYSNPLVNSMPEFGKNGVASFTLYLNQGYYGLSLCLDQDFVWTKGVGHSWALQTLIGQYFQNTTFMEDTYQFRAEGTSGWSGYANWHSIYPALASDFTFPGAVIIMFGIGWLACRLWYESIYEQRLVSICLFIKLTMLIAYSSCNNQIMLGRPEFISTWGLILLWLFKVPIGKTKTTA
jgi:hypothetical protein